MMCTIVLNDLVRKMAEIPLSVGKNYEVLTISFNPAETTTLAAAKKRNYLQAYGRAGAEDGWRFLVGTPGPIAAVTRAVGFRYKFDAATNQFVHPSVVMVLTPDGRVARYFFGTGYEPKDLRLALVEASERKVGSATDSVLLWCYHYDPTRGKYTLAVMKAVRIGGAVIVAAVAALVVLLLRRERRTGTAAAGPPGSPARGSDMAGKT
jgi:protein SCO1/2